MTEPNAFQERRENDPQGLIDDLVRQTSSQAAIIRKLTQQTENCLSPEEAELLLGLLTNVDGQADIKKKLQRIKKAKK